MRFLRQHPLALVVIAGLLAGGLAIAAAQAPDNTEPQDFHGRTWLTASAKGGDQLVLVNGISGLIEGRSQGGATIPDGARFIDSTPTSTLVGSGEGVTVVDSGTQEAVTKQGVNGDRSVLTDDLVVTLGRGVRVLPASLTGRARAVPGAPTPIADSNPVRRRVERRLVPRSLRERPGGGEGVRQRSDDRGARRSTGRPPACW